MSPGSIARTAKKRKGEFNLDLQDKVTLITGASGGIGRALACAFAEKGAQVVVHYNSSKPKAEETLKMMAGSGHIIYQADLEDPESTAELVEKTVEKYGHLDILVNNAGVFDLHPVGEQTYTTWQNIWQKTLGINLIAAANLCFLVSGVMQKNGGGKIINISSRGAFRGEPAAPAYGASKAGMNALGQSLAQALAPQNIFVYTIAPGFVNTERVSPILNGPDGESIKRQSPFNRVAEPEEIAKTALFLAGEDNHFLTGCIIDVNGASYLRT
jgi:NAD(P)-dependent dehydrogenase (short-subunit alcohol dehydrogenase family)